MTEEDEVDLLMLEANRAIGAAIDGHHKAGRHTTHVIDGRWIRIHPDGTSEDLGVFEQAQLWSEHPVWTERTWEVLAMPDCGLSIDQADVFFEVLDPAC